MPRAKGPLADGRISTQSPGPAKKVAWGKRLITAAVAIPTIGLLLWLPWPVFSAAVTIATGLGYYEFAGLAGIRDNRVMLSMVLMIVLILTARDYAAIVAPYVLCLIPLVLFGPTEGFRAGILNVFFFYTFAYPISYGAVIRADFQASGSRLTALWILLSFASDAGALILGSRIGKHLLCPLVSPAKTWEGLLGAVLAGTGSGVFFHIVGLVPTLSLADYILLGLSEALVGMIGDLVESGFKRYTSSKDSGSLLPGHGGMLDRLDALAATAPVAYYFFLYKDLI
jgi:phosphatidate cytidylyltransferase